MQQMWIFFLLAQEAVTTAASRRGIRGAAEDRSSVQSRRCGRRLEHPVLSPVFITPNGSGSCILLGCGSKLFQMGPVVTNAHNKAIKAVELANARVVNG